LLLAKYYHGLERGQGHRKMAAPKAPQWEYLIRSKIALYKLMVDSALLTSVSLCRHYIQCWYLYWFLLQIANEFEWLKPTARIASSVYLETKLAPDVVKHCKSTGKYLDVTADVETDNPPDTGIC
jgi:hypothetical protein